jgi:phosphohistidine phosphatase
MELLLVRHAIAFDRDLSRWRNDALRPLTPRGIQRMGRAAAGARRIAFVPSRLLTSPLVRARQTAQILASKARWPEPIVAEALAPARPLRNVLLALGAQRVARLAVVGHEPDLGHLLAYCIGAEPGMTQLELRKGGMACVAFEGAVRFGGGRLAWLLPPRILRAMAR